MQIDTVINGLVFRTTDNGACIAYRLRFRALPVHEDCTENVLYTQNVFRPVAYQDFYRLSAQQYADARY